MRISTYNCLSSHYIPKNKGEVSKDGCMAYGCPYDTHICELQEKKQTQYERIEPVLQKIIQSDVFFLQELEQQTFLEIRKAHQEAHQEVWDAVYEPRYHISPLKSPLGDSKDGCAVFIKTTELSNARDQERAIQTQIRHEMYTNNRGKPILVRVHNNGCYLSFHASKTYESFLSDLLNILRPMNFDFIILGGDLNRELETLPEMEGYVGERASTNNVPTMTGEGESHWKQLDQIIVYSKLVYSKPEISEVQVDDVVFKKNKRILVKINKRAPNYCYAAFFKLWIDGKKPASDHRLLSCIVNLKIEHDNGLSTMMKNQQELEQNTGEEKESKIEEKDHKACSI